MYKDLAKIRTYIDANVNIITDLLKEEQIDKVNLITIGSCLTNIVCYLDNITNCFNIDTNNNETKEQKPTTKTQETKKKSCKRIPPQTIQQIIQLRKQQKTYREISEIVGIDYRRVWDIIKRYGDLL